MILSEGGRQMKKIIAAAAVAALLPVHSAFATVDTAKSACVINGFTGEVVFEKNADERLPMASTTKIMTAYIALTTTKLDDVVTISPKAQATDGTGMYVAAGEQYYMEDMLYGLMLNSGNDAVVAIAEHISGSEEAFADKMNETAWSMGAGNTMFCNANGLPHSSHYTTAKDLALITKKAMDIPKFREIVSTRSRTVWQVPRPNADGTAMEVPPAPKELYNHNKLLNMYDGAIGVKTGYTDAAGRCLVSAAQRDGMTFIGVTLNDNDDWNTHMQLLDDAFASHHPSTLVKAGQVLKEVTLDGRKYTFSSAQTVIIPLKDGDKPHVNTVLELDKDLASEIRKGERVGTVKFSSRGKTLCEVVLAADSDVSGIGKYRVKNGFYELWRNIWDFFLI